MTDFEQMQVKIELAKLILANIDKSDGEFFDEFDDMHVDCQNLSEKVNELYKLLS